MAAGDNLTDSYPLEGFGEGNYHLRVYGPNGYFRAFRGNADDPSLSVNCHYQQAAGPRKQLTGDIALHFRLGSPGDHFDITVTDNAYKKNEQSFSISAENLPHGDSPFVLELASTQGWYDYTVRVRGHEDFEVRYAGRVETGAPGITDPFMGGVV